MQRSLNARQSKTFRKLREIAGSSLAQLSTESGVELQRLRGFELNRLRLSQREALRVYAVLFQILATRIGEMRDADRMVEILEQLPGLDIPALTPFSVPPF